MHIRFKNIARGGIRILSSRNPDEYSHNSGTAFEECYNLAYTQHLKNKDIPEGGAKGLIVLALDAYNEGEAAFKAYADALLDLMTAHTSNAEADGSRPVFFLGPDEGSAGLMDWACERARKRGHRYWRGFTTGKKAALGGISHIDYGMTTASVHEYVLGILRKHKILERDVLKIQTGGPDGDLGGNEILISKDRTIAVVDGSGVLYDPHGIDRRELRKLAKKRLPVEAFPKEKLNHAGFLVRIQDSGLRLPDGETVRSGTAFRNVFHFSKYARGTLFLPCGGRPRSINMSNVSRFFLDDGSPRFEWIVEGANLFITQEARKELEKKGVILIKDASANKGGVSASSLEVLAGLALNDDEYRTHMCVQNGKIPDFRKRYIDGVIERIKENAAKEFELLWRIHAETGTAMCDVSDEIGGRINAVTDEIAASGLMRKKKLVETVIAAALPNALLSLVGINTIIRRLPPDYCAALFARTIARTLVYEHGVNPRYEEYRMLIKRFEDAAAEAIPPS